MQVKTIHSASSYGQPVILAEDGSLMDYAPGIKALQETENFRTVTDIPKS